MENIGILIKEARQKRELSQENLAQVVGTTKSAISRYESGKRVPTLGQIMRIADALGVHVDDLLGVKKFETWEDSEKHHAELLNSTPKDGSPGAMLKQVWGEMNEDGHEKVAEYAADILPTHRKQQ